MSGRPGDEYEQPYRDQRRDEYERDDERRNRQPRDEPRRYPGAQRPQETNRRGDSYEAQFNRTYTTQPVAVPQGRRESYQPPPHSSQTSNPDMYRISSRDQPANTRPQRRSDNDYNADNTAGTSYRESHGPDNRERPHRDGRERSDRDNRRPPSPTSMNQGRGSNRDVRERPTRDNRRPSSPGPVNQARGFDRDNRDVSHRDYNHKPPSPDPVGHERTSNQSLGNDQMQRLERLDSNTRVERSQRPERPERAHHSYTDPPAVTQHGRNASFTTNQPGWSAPSTNANFAAGRGNVANRGASNNLPYRPAQNHPASTQPQGQPNPSTMAIVPISPATSNQTPEINLNATTRGFVDIDIDDFDECVKFWQAYPKLLKEDPQIMTNEAFQVYLQGRKDLGDRIVQRLFIIRYCRAQNYSTEECLDYIDELASRRSAFRAHKKDCEKLTKDISDRLAATSPDTTKYVLPTVDGDKRKIEFRGNIQPQATSADALDESYYVRDDGYSFFKPGRVFKILWAQPAGADRKAKVNQAGNIYPGMYHEPMHNSLRWMLVVFNKRGYCICCPISTYSGKGLVEKNIPKQEIQSHAIIHTNGLEAQALPGEPKLYKDPIPVVMARGQLPLDPESRVHFGKHHTVEWNVKVMEIGCVRSDIISTIQYHFLKGFNAKPSR